MDKYENLCSLLILNLTYLIRAEVFGQTMFSVKNTLLKSTAHDQLV